MARVYRGRDLLLKRTIAVKVLKDQMTGDAAFIRRFEREAQSAAALSHPHIVNIYDVGEENGIYFMVMEYVDGRNLKDHIREKGRLPVEEAMHIASQIAEALEEAHAAGMVHRDIKPQNILFSRDGKVKVTDFGIAIAGDGVTVTVGDQIVGSVQYISPEQARGGIAIKQSDLYSLGIVLYEMVTGKVPFTGESPVALAMKHVQEEIVPPRRLVPGIPRELEQIILKAVQKDTAERYTSTSEFLEDLRSVGRKESPKITSARAFTGGNDDDDLIMRPSHKRSKSVLLNMRILRKLVKPLLALIVMGLLVFTAWFYIENYLTVPEVSVPEVYDLSQSEAVRALKEAGLMPNEEIFYVYDDEIDVGNVVKTDPPVGRMVREDRAVDLYVSKGPEFIVTPTLTGRTEQEARVILRDLNLSMSVVREYNDDVSEGVIYHQVPGESFPSSPGDEVVVYISQGRGPFKLADLIGYSEKGAIAYLKENDLTPVVRFRFSIGSTGYVIDQMPEPGSEVLPGQSVDLVVGQ
jgi:eukaryotic-like serine/threonine-protein kinase